MVDAQHLRQPGREEGLKKCSNNLFTDLSINKILVMLKAVAPGYCNAQR